MWGTVTNGSKIQCLPRCCFQLDSFHSLPLHSFLCVCGKYPPATTVSHSGSSFEKPNHSSYAFIAVCVLWCLTDLLFFTVIHKRLAERAVMMLYKRQPHWSCPPDGSSGVDLCHHLLPPTDGSKISHFPHGVVFDNIAHSEGGAGATLVEGFAVFRMTQGT